MQVAQCDVFVFGHSSCNLQHLCWSWGRCVFTDRVCLQTKRICTLTFLTLVL